MTAPSARPSLKLLLTAPSVGLVVLAVVPCCAVLLWAGQRAVESVATRLHEKIAEEIVHYLDEYLGYATRVAKDIAMLAEHGMLAPEQPSLVVRLLQDRLEGGSAVAAGYGKADGEVFAVGAGPSGGQVARIASADDDGWTQLHAVGPHGELGELIDRSRMVLGEQDWYRQGMASDGGRWTTIHPNHLRYAYLMSAVHPIAGKDGRAVGVAIAAVSVDGISRFLASINSARDGILFIVSRETGEIVASSDAGAPAQSADAGADAKASEHGQRLLEAFVTRYGSLTDVEQAAFSHRIGHTGYRVRARPYTPGQQLDWLMVTAYPRSLFLGPLYRYAGAALLIGLAMTLLALVAAAQLTRSIGRPIARLSAAARQAADEQQPLYPGRVPLGRIASREIAELRDVLVTTTGRLHHSIDELRRLNVAYQESEQRLQQVMESLPVGAMLHDARGSVVYMNDVARRIIGLEGAATATATATATDDGAAALKSLEAFAIRRVLAGEVVAGDCLELRVGERRVPVEVWSSPVSREGEDGPQVVSALQDITERRAAEERLVHQANHDHLTGLANRTQLISRLELALARLRRRPGEGFALLFLDLDNFKVINDSLGHLVGDRVLVEMARRMRAQSRQADLAVRLGGDEFVLMLEHVQSREEVAQVAERVHEALGQPVELDDMDSVVVGVSGGIVYGDTSYETGTELLRDADIALYRAKASGKGRHVLFDESMRELLLRRRELEQELRRALEADLLDVHFQPIVRLDTGELTGFEALCRWQHPTLGPVSPAEFIPLAEECGIIATLDRWVLRRVCRVLRAWTLQIPGARDIRVTINLSSAGMLRQDLPDYLDELTEAHSLRPRQLGIELTESMLVEDVTSAADVLNALRGRGFYISIDDFGTGYSSLSYLATLPVDTLKIDKSFVDGLGTTPRSTVIVNTILALTNELGIDAVAEGIERDEQLAALRGCGCEQGQGYLFSRPVPHEVAEAMLHQRQRWPAAPVIRAAPPRRRSS